MRIWPGIVVLILLASSAAAKDYPANEQPMYGGVAKPAALVEADQHFIETVLKRGYTRAKGSDDAVTTGWNYFFQKDLATAMKRFNQAWLLDPDNGDAFHGFALVLMERDHDSAGADMMFKTGEAKSRQSPGIYLDYGRFLLLQKRPTEAIVQLQKALSFPDMGPNAEALLTGAYADAGNLPAACLEARKVPNTVQAPYRKAVDLILTQCTGQSPR